MREKSDPFDLSRHGGHRPVSDLAYAAIRQAIFRGLLVPGQKLVTADLAARMKVSRTPVREAIRKLEIDGLVKSEPWRCVVVADLPSLEEIEEFYYLRGAVEGLVAYFAALRRPAAALAGLKAVIEKMEADAADGNLERFMVLQVDFWDRYIGLASSKRLFQIASVIRDSLERAKPVSLAQPGRSEIAIRELRGVFEAIEAGEPERAESLAREHCRNAYEAYRAVMEKRLDIA